MQRLQRPKTLAAAEQPADHRQVLPADEVLTVDDVSRRRVGPSEARLPDRIG